MEQETVSPNSDSNILIAYFTMPEDVDTEGVDAIAGASIVVNGGEVMGNVEYMASIIQIWLPITSPMSWTAFGQMRRLVA